MKITKQFTRTEYELMKTILDSISKEVENQGHGAGSKFAVNFDLNLVEQIEIKTLDQKFRTLGL